MRVLVVQETMNVDGGGLFAAIAALIAIFTLPKILNDHSQEYAEWGQNLSQKYWDDVYP
jgi:hypothetical protein